MTISTCDLYDERGAWERTQPSRVLQMGLVQEDGEWRIDTVPDADGRWRLMEAELIEPDFYLGHDPRSGAGFARAVRQRLEQA